MASFQEKAVSVYKDVSKVPALTNLLVVKDKTDTKLVHWEAKWSQRDHDRNEKISYKSIGMVTLNKEGQGFEAKKLPTCFETKGEKAEAFTPNSKTRAVLREVTIKDVKNDFLEFWTNITRIISINLTERDVHGPVIYNPSFGCLEWSHCNSMVLYVAEKKVPKSQSFFKKPADKDDIIPGDEYVHSEDWGEQLVGCSNPILIKYDIEKDVVTPMPNVVPEGISVSAAYWLKDYKSLIIHGWKTKPFRLGLIYCKNRPSVLYHYLLEDKKITDMVGEDENTCVFSPRVGPNGTNLYYIETKIFGPHSQCGKLMKIELVKGILIKLVDVVNLPQGPDSFQGIFTEAIPQKCFHGKNLIFNSWHRSHGAILSVDTENGAVKILENTGNWQVQAIEGDLIFASFSTPVSPPVLKVGLLKEGSPINWTVIDSPGQDITGIKWEVIKHVAENPNKDYSVLDYESILIRPDEGEVRGLVVNPHGGPHTVSFCGYDHFSAGLCKLGYAVLRVNYRGSLGFGQDSVYSLIGNIGTQDVKDVQQAACEAVKLLNVPASKVFVHGGSHGGFLTLHLIGQYPDFYVASAVRNPVTNIAGMVGLTDIIDWCLSEAGQSFDYDKPLTDCDYNKLCEVSPIRYVSEVKSPLLMMLGLADLRVPPQQGIEYSKRLRASGGKVRVQKYEKNDHPIAEVAAEADCFMNMAMWFYKHGPTDK